MTLSLSLVGDRRLLDLFARAGAGAGPALVQATVESAQSMLADSQEIVPVDTGALRASGQVWPPHVSGGDVEVVIGYGGAAVQYAIYVHEDLGANHAPGTSAKYLEIPVTRRVPTWEAEIARRVQALLT